MLQSHATCSWQTSEHRVQLKRLLPEATSGLSDTLSTLLSASLQGKGVLDSNLPEMPPNVHTVYHTNECFDWGTFGWVRAWSPLKRAAAWVGAVPMAAVSLAGRLSPPAVPCAACRLTLGGHVELAPLCRRPLSGASPTPRATSTSSSSTRLCAGPSSPPTGRCVLVVVLWLPALC